MLKVLWHFLYGKLLLYPELKTLLAVSRLSPAFYNSNKGEITQRFQNFIFVNVTFPHPYYYTYNSLTSRIQSVHITGPYLAIIFRW